MPAGAPPVQAVAFDAFGTLFDLEALREPAGDAVFEGFAQRFIPWTWLATATASEYVPLPELAEMAFAAAGAGDPAALAARLDSLPAFGDVEAALDELRDLPLAILSNGTGDGLSRLISRAGLAGRFEHVLSADAVGRFKPAPELYALAPAAFGSPPAGVLLVSSNEWDVAGAVRAGLSTAWLGRGRRPSWVLGTEPDAELDGLQDLGAVLRAWRDPEPPR